MYLDTRKIKESGNEIVRLSELIRLDVDEYYNLINKLTSDSWVGISADKFKKNCYKNKDDNYILIAKIKQQGKKFVELSEDVERQIELLMR